MCVVKSTRPRRKVHACARFANTQSFFVSSRDSTHHLTTMEQEKKQRESIDDYEEAQSFLKQEEDQDNLDLDRFPPPPTMIASSSSSKGLSNRFWISACVNTASTAAIVRKKSPQKNQKIQPPKHLSHNPNPPKSRSSSTNASSKPPPSATPK